MVSGSRQLPSLANFKKKREFCSSILKHNAESPAFDHLTASVKVPAQESAIVSAISWCLRGRSVTLGRGLTRGNRVTCSFCTE
jgi:hypothetical protein